MMSLQTYNKIGTKMKLGCVYGQKWGFSLPRETEDYM
jgi:hypothetical protein